MATVKANYGSGGAKLTPKGAGEPNLALVLREIADDETELRVQFEALLAQLDTEGGLGGGYVTAFTPAAQKHLKG